MRSLLCCAALCFAVMPTGPVESADVVGMIVDLVGREDPDFRAIGLERIRYAAQGEAATRQFTALLANQPPAHQIELLRALADRGDKTAIPAITALLTAAKDPAVRSEAVAALGALGGGAEVAVLQQSLVAGDPERAAAKRALVVLGGDEAVAQMTSVARSGEASLRAVAIDILTERRARAGVPVFVAAATDADMAVRTAAMRGLAKLGGPDEVPAMVQGVLKAAAGQERNDAERALVVVCTENPGKEQAAESFMAIFKAAGDADREVLLSPLGRIGGPTALAIVDDLLADPAKRDLGLKALTRWPDATVVPKLLDMLGSTQNADDREMLLIALIRIAPLPDNKLNDKQKFDLVVKLMPLCATEAERAKLLERVNAIRIVETLRFLIPYLDEPALAEAACKSVVEMAHHRWLRDAYKAEFTKALDKVIATTKNQELVERANHYKADKTWQRK